LPIHKNSLFVASKEAFHNNTSGSDIPQGVFVSIITGEAASVVF